MARRVNTKFVIVLSGILVLLGGGVVYKAYTMRRGDPVELKARGDSAIQKGDSEAAIQFYNKAITAAKQQNYNPTKVADMRCQVAELYLSTADRDINRLGEAFKSWKRALVEDPSHLSAQERLLTEMYEFSRLTAREDDWKQTEIEAENLLKLDPKNGTAHARLGEAILARIKPGEENRERSIKARAELEKAITLMPDSVRPVDYLARYYMMEAERVELDKPREAIAYRVQAEQMLQEFCDKHPKDLEAWTSLAGRQLEMAVKESTPERIAAIEKTLESMRAAGPNDKQTYKMIYKYHSEISHKLPEMETALRKVVELDPSTMENHVMLGQYYRFAARENDSIAAFKEALTHRSTTNGLRSLRDKNLATVSLVAISEQYMTLAERAGLSTPVGKQNMEDAKLYREQARAKEPSSVDVMVLDGRSALLEGRTAEAIRLLRAADQILSASNVSMMPKWASVKALLAGAFERMGDYGLAAAQMQALVEKYPTVPQYLRHKAELELRMQRFPQAEASAAALLKLNKNDEDAQRIYSQAMLAQGKTQAIGDLLEKVDLDNSPAPTIVALAQMQLFNQQADQAIVTLSKLLAKNPGHESAVVTAFSAYKATGRMEEARQLVEKALAAAPANLQFRLIAKHLAKPEASISDLQREVIEQLPAGFERCMALAQYWNTQQQPEKAMPELLSAEKIKPDNATVIEEIFNNAIKLKQWDVAARYAQRAAALNIDGVNGRFYQGRLELEHGDRENAVRILYSAVTDRPDFSLGWTVLGDTYRLLGRNREAVDALQRAIDQRPSNLPAYKALIATYISQGTQESIQNARAALARAIGFTPQDEQLRQWKDSFDDLYGDVAENVGRRVERYKADPNDWENARRLAALYVRGQKLDNALELLLQMHTRKPMDLPVAESLARLYAYRNEITKALAIYQELLSASDVMIRHAARVSMGDLYALLNQPAQAEQIYRDAVANAPADTTDASRRLGDLYFQQGESQKAAEVYKVVYERSQDLRVLRRYIESNLRMGNYTEGERMLDEQVLKRDPNDQEGLLLRGFSRLQQNKLDEARKVFEAVLAINPDNADALHYHAVVLLGQKADMRLIRQDLERVRTLRPSALLSRTLLARIYRQQTLYAESYHEYFDVINLYPMLKELRIECAEFLLSLCEDSVRLLNDKSERAFALRSLRPVDQLSNLLTDSANRFPDDSRWESMRGEMLARSGRTDEALSLLEKSFTKTGESLDVGLVYLRGLLLAQRYPKVVEVATHLLATNPKAGHLLLYRGKALSSLNKREQAAQDFGTALVMAGTDWPLQQTVVATLHEAMPTDAVGLLQKQIDAHPGEYIYRLTLAMEYLNLGQFQDAVKTVTPVPANVPAAQASIGWRFTSMALHQAKDYPGARQAYTKWLEIEPENVEALNNLAYLLGDEMRQPSEGRPFAEKAASVLERQTGGQAIYVNAADVYDTLGWLRYLCNDADAAADALGRSIQLRPVPLTYFHMAQVQQHRGKKQEAREALNLCLKLARANKDPVLESAEQLGKTLLP